MSFIGSMILSRSLARELIRSRSNSLVKRFRAVKDRTGEAALLEGPRLIEEAVLSGVGLLEVAVTPRAERSSRCRRLLGQLAARGVPVHLMHEDVIASLSEAETCQGLLALARRPDFPEDARYRGTPLVVVAVELQNPGNLGGLIRTAEAAGATGAYLTRGTADAFAWKALRGSMGSAFRLPQVAGLALEEVLRRLARRGVRVAATGSGGASRYHEVDLRGPMAFVFGNEGAGLPESVLEAADVVVGIPLRGGVESLNVGVAAGILLFEAARQRRA
jgi:RNA methyltransferase, TrmH family